MHSMSKLQGEDRECDINEEFAWEWWSFQGIAYVWSEFKFSLWDCQKTVKRELISDKYRWEISQVLGQNEGAWWTVREGDFRKLWVRIWKSWNSVPDADLNDSRL